MMQILKPDKPDKLLTLIVAAFLLLFLAAACRQNKTEEAAVNTTGADADTAVLRKVTFMPYWSISTQFAAYYAGKEKGIYKKHGIDLHILTFEPYVNTSDYLKSCKVDFMALWLSSAIEMKDKGVDLVNIAQFSSRSSLMMVAKKSSGIRTIKDAHGKRIGVWPGFEIQVQALARKYGIQLEIVPIGSNNVLFLKDVVDLTLANWFDEYHGLINSGYDPDELTTFFFADYGLNFPEDGLYCLSEKLAGDPGLCARFAKATIESWQWCFDHPEETIDIIARISAENITPVNKAHLAWILARYKDQMIPKGRQGINVMLEEKDYLQVAGELLNSGLIKNRIPYDSFFYPYSRLK